MHGFFAIARFGYKIDGMNGLDYAVVFKTIVILFATLAALLLVLLAFRRAREVQGLGYAKRNSNVVLARISFWATILAAIFGGLYLLLGHHAWALYAVAGLLCLSVLATLFIRLPRPEKKRSLREQIAHHAFFAWPWRHKWIIIPAAFVIAIFFILVYQAVDLRQNRAAFVQARAAIDTIYADIVAQLGPPDNYRRTNSCSRPSQEFEQGPLSCDVSTDFIYGVDNQAQANQLTKQIRSVIHQSGLLIATPAPRSDIYATPAPSNYVGSENDYFKTVDGLGCSIKYSYDLPQEIGLKLNNSRKKVFSIAFGCSDYAREQFYSLHRASY